MTLPADEFIRRFLLHVLPSGFHRIRHYGFLASPGRAATIGRLRELIAADCDGAPASATICPRCGGRMRVIETFARGAEPRSFKAEPAGIDSS